MREVAGYTFHIVAAGRSPLACFWYIPFASAHRAKSREWGRLKAKVEPLLTLGISGNLVQILRVNLRQIPVCGLAWPTLFGSKRMGRVWHGVAPCEVTVG